MKRIAGVSIIALCIILVTPVTPSPTLIPNVYTGDCISGSGIEHQKYYSWGLNSGQIPQDEEIVSATILFKGLHNWDNLENHLYVNALGDAPTPLLLGSLARTIRMTMSSSYVMANRGSSLF